MDKIHKKANKLFDEVSKRKNKAVKTDNKDSTKRNTEYAAGLSYKSCIYCQKVFINSKFLMKHLLRRHSDELVLFYKNLTDREMNTSSDLQHFISILKKEFSSLKKELISIKLVSGKSETEENQPTEREETIVKLKRNENVNSDIVSDEIGNLKEKIIDVEKDIQSLNHKFLELDNMLKNEVLMKQDINEKPVLSEEKIMQAQESQFIELRQILLNELKSLLYNRQQEISSEWKSQLLELRNEIRRLDFAIDNVKQQLKCTDSLKKEILTDLVPHIIPYMGSRNCEKKNLKHSLSKSELSVNKSYQTSQHQVKSLHENFSSKESNYKNFKEQSISTIETDHELASAVADKLAQFSITPDTSKISCSQFNKVVRLLSIEKERFSKKYNNFYEIYNKLNIAADQKAHSKLKSKKHHKIKFAEPLTSSRSSLNNSSFEGSMHEQSPSIQKSNRQLTCTKNPMTSDSKYVSPKTHSARENTSFTFPDKGASGDSVLLSNKRNIPRKHSNLSSIKEFETSDYIEDSQNSKDYIASFSKDKMPVFTEQPEYKTLSNTKTSIEQKGINIATNTHSSHLRKCSSITSPENDESDDSVHVFLEKQIMPKKHTKFNSIKQLETSPSIEGIQNSKNLNVTFSKGSVVVTTNYSKYKNEPNFISPAEHRKFNSAINSPIQLEKTSDKYNEFEDYCKSQDDLDDVSSLETYKSSDDEDDHIATY